MSLFDTLLAKITSGRWIITLAATFVFTYLSIFEILPIDKVMEILLLVFYAYFSKPRTNENGK